MSVWRDVESDADRAIRRECQEKAPLLTNVADRFKKLANLSDASSDHKKKCIKLSELAGELAQRMREV